MSLCRRVCFLLSLSPRLVPARWDWSLQAARDVHVASEQAHRGELDTLRADLARAHDELEALRRGAAEHQQHTTVRCAVLCCAVLCLCVFVFLHNDGCP